MLRVIDCVTEQHNHWLILLAAAICVAASAGVFFVLGGLDSASKHRRRWLALAALLAGGGTWATHFVAMLGYKPGLPIGFDLSLTLLSAATCVLGAWIAIEVYDRFTNAAARIGAGLILGTAIVAMHFIGTMGIEAAAHKVWALDLVAASWLLSCAFSIASLQAFWAAPARHRLALSAGFLVLAIVSLHFTAMGALSLVPDPRLVAPIGAMNTHLLAATVATVAAAGLLVGVVLVVADRRIAATELAAARQAAAMALHDALTGLPNRRHLSAVLQERLAKRRPKQKIALIAVDLDRFKPVNDLYGHAVGDELLIAIARLLKEEAAEDGFVARLGGDEFILVVDCDDEADFIGRLSSLVAKFDAPLRLAEHEVSVGATLGVAVAPNDGEEADVLMRRADAALYRAKDDGRGRFSFFEPGMDARAMERAALERELREAVRNDEIIPFYQPLVDLSTGEVNGYEVLARWPHRIRGLIEPQEFIHVAEESGVIGDLTLNVLRRACRETLNWPGRPRISFNVAPSQLRDTALAQKVLKVLAECGFPPARLEIEITEDALVADLDSARHLLMSLKNLGVRVSLDDFGTGYSSLRHLRELPFDLLKIDRSFVQSMNDSSEARTIVTTIVQLAHNLGLGVTAEGIETEAQAAELQALGCERGQGYLLGRPGPAPPEQGADETPHATAVAR